MNVNTGLNQLNNYVNTTDLTKMSQSQSLTGSIASSLKEGEVFEGTVNSVENGKVTIGLANGQTMTARLDTGVSITQGQSIFFEVKSNDGSLVQIRPVSVNSLEANPTLLRALDMANLAANTRTVTMVNSMMEQSMSINPENLISMNRAVANNPQVDPQIIVTMSKYNMEITPDNISMFQNYASDKASLMNNFDVISDMLPKLMASSETSVADVINLNKGLTEIFINNNPDSFLTETVNNESMVNGAMQSEQEVAQGVIDNPSENPKANNNPLNANFEQTIELVKGENLPEAQKADTVESAVQTTVNNSAVSKEETVLNQAKIQANTTEAQEQSVGTNTINTFANDKQISAFNTLLNSMPDFPKANTQIFDENNLIKADANANELFKEISSYLSEYPNIPKETLNSIIRSPLYKGLVQSLINNSFSLNPSEVNKPGEISKLYEKVLKQNEALERLVNNFSSKEADLIKTQTTEIKQNVNFMNSANEMYNFVQIPLKMYNQNTDGMLYVHQNKKSSFEEGEEITAFLHFDMENLGPTDVFIALKSSNVNCKWNLADEESMNLIENNLDILTERLEKKGFSISSQVTCGEAKADFVEDFLGAPPIFREGNSEGLVHRYSFDMRA